MFSVKIFFLTVRRQWPEENKESRFNVISCNSSYLAGIYSGSKEDEQRFFRLIQHQEIVCSVMLQNGVKTQANVSG